MRKRSLVSVVLVLAFAFTLLAPVAAYADGGTAGPFYLAITNLDSEKYVRGGRVLSDADFGPDFRPRAGDQIFWTEAIYHSGPGGAKGTRAGRSAITCLLMNARDALCDGALVLRDRGTLYVKVLSGQQRTFTGAIIGGTREFNTARGAMVIKGLSERRTLYELRLR